MLTVLFNLFFVQGGASLADWGWLRISQAGVRSALFIGLRLTLLLFAVSCAMAGCVLALGLVAGGGVPMVNGVFYTDVDAKVLLTAAAAAYLVLTVVFRAAAGKGVRGELVRAQVCLAGRTTAFTAFCDTGNACGIRSPERRCWWWLRDGWTARFQERSALCWTAGRWSVPQSCWSP